MTVLMAFYASIFVRSNSRPTRHHIPHPAVQPLRFLFNRLAVIFTGMHCRPLIGGLLLV